jgi:hypothetical protein
MQPLRLGRPFAGVFALALALTAGAVARGATPQELWPAQIPAGDAGAVSAHLRLLDDAARSIAPQLLPALQFQKVFAQILAGSPSAQWRAELDRLAQLPANDPVAQAVRQLAKVWLARARMQELDAALRGYYRHHVAFPPSLAQVERDVPAALRTDPWGEPWAYGLRAPHGFPKQTDQRYRLAPARYPDLLPLAAAITHREAMARPWKITPREVGGTRALAFQAASGATLAVIQPGGAAGDCVLAFAGPNWALMAGPDQLFAVNF